MIYINHNSTLLQLENLIDNSFEKKSTYLQNDLNKKYSDTLDLLKSRVNLESIIEESIDFNKKLNFEVKKKLTFSTNC